LFTWSRIFLVPYVIITIGFGLTFMVLEFAVGRYYQTSVISCLCNIGKRFKVPGIVIVGISFAILSYYLVVIGWVFSFTVFMIIGSDLDFESLTNSWLPVLSFVLVLGFTYAIVRRGITKGRLELYF